MELKKEPCTQVHANDEGQIIVIQPGEECSHCDSLGQAYVYFSPDRARKVAAEIMRLADELEQGGE